MRAALARILARRPRPRAWPRRATILLVVGYSETVYGLGIATAAPTLDRFGRQLPVVDDVLNSRGAGAAWIFCGVVAFVCGVIARRTPHPYGFTSLLLPPLIWTCLYSLSWVIWLATGGAYGYGRGWVTAASTFGTTVFVLVTSGWRDAPPLPPAQEADPEPDEGA